jgi:hypothetical protein
VEFKDRWIIVVFLTLLIFSLVSSQTRTEILMDGAAQASLWSLSGPSAGEHPDHKTAYSSAAKTVALSCRDKFFTLFDLLETILDPGSSHENSQKFVGVMEKEFSRSGGATE